jgi:nitrate/TMAO reductase-like tetraheme cytochrome c subunit
MILLAYRTFLGAQALLPVAREAGVSLVLAGFAEEPETHDSAQLADSQPPLFTVRARGEVLLRVDLLASGEADAAFVKVAGQAEREADLDALQGRIDQLRKDAIALSPLDPVAKLKTEKLVELEGRKSKLAATPPARFPPGRNSFTYAFVSMSPSLPQEPQVRSLMDEYTAQVATKNLAWVQAHPRTCPVAAAGEAAYTGDQQCIDCHQEAYDFWKTTPHAKAYPDLVKRQKQYDTSCISCHVVGYQKPGGTCDVAQTSGRESVQCESCHGAGSLHAEAGEESLIALKVPEKQCRTCHDPENSPHFNDATYRPQILGPGHGMPLGRKKN